MKIKQKAIFIIILLLIFLTCTMLWLWYGDKVTHIISNDGTRDLRNADFASSSFDLSGPVEYIPNVFLTPEMFGTRRDMTLTGDPADSASYSTGRLLIYVPVGVYGIMLWNAEFASNIFINGQFVENVGIPAVEGEQYVLETRLLYYTVDASDGVIEIVQQASNYATLEKGGYADIVIGTPEAVRKMYAKENIIPSIVSGCFIVLFLAHLVLYSMRPIYKANLWFALFCLVFFIRTGYTSPWILSSLLPLSWVTMLRLQYLAFSVGLLLLYLTFDALFPLILQKWFRYVIIAISAVFTFIFLFANTIFIFKTLTYFYYIVLIIFIYILARLFMRLRKPNIEQVAILTGMYIFMLGGLLDMVVFNVFPTLMSTTPNISDLTKRTSTEYALLVFVLFQMTAMFRGTMREITEAKEKEQELVLENALLAREAKVREEMVRDLSHEVRTPLTVISSYVQLAMRQFKQGAMDELIMEGLDVISEEAHRIADLTSRTLSAREPEVRPVDIGRIARQLVRLLSPMAQHTERKITINITERIVASCNVGEITQVIWNLLDNALKHSDSRNIEVDGNSNNESAYIIVSDYGKGIPADILPDIFKRGVSGEGGSGLGLAIANEIVQNHGGRLIVESEYGMGTKVTLVLPAYLMAYKGSK